MPDQVTVLVTYAGNLLYTNRVIKGTNYSRVKGEAKQVSAVFFFISSI